MLRFICAIQEQAGKNTPLLNLQTPLTCTSLLVSKVYPSSLSSALGSAAGGTRWPRGPSNLNYSLIPCNELEFFQNVNGKGVGRLLLESQIPNETYTQVVVGHPPLQVLPAWQSSGTCCCLFSLCEMCSWYKLGKTYWFQQSYFDWGSESWILGQKAFEFRWCQRFLERWDPVEDSTLHLAAQTEQCLAYALGKAPGNYGRVAACSGGWQNPVINAVVHN